MRLALRHCHCAVQKHAWTPYNTSPTDLHMHVTCRQLGGAWMEWRKVSQAYGAAGMASSLSCGQLGPACFCPACAALPTDPTDEEPTTTGVCAWHT